MALSLENPFNDPKGVIFKSLKYLDYFTSTVFILEMIIKVVSKGFLCNGSTSYLRSSSNALDFTIVIISTVSYMNVSKNVNYFKIMRMAKLLKPLRVIARNENLQLSIQALQKTIPAVSALLVIVILFLVIFAIIGINLLKGRGFYCETESISLSRRDIEVLIRTREDCLNYGAAWVRDQSHFDNIRNALVQMVVMSQTVNWPIIHSKFINSRGPDLVPGYKESRNLSFFFVGVIIFCALFIMNLFVGVIINAFNNEKERLGKNFLLTEDQRKALETKILALKMRPIYVMIRHKTNKLN